MTLTTMTTTTASRAGATLGRIKTERKAQAARANGALGGRPPMPAQSFPTWEAAFAECRRQDKPLKVQVPITPDQQEVARIYPSGRCVHVEYLPAS